MSILNHTGATKRNPMGDERDGTQRLHLYAYCYNSFQPHWPMSTDPQERLSLRTFI